MRAGGEDVGILGFRDRTDGLCIRPLGVGGIETVDVLRDNRRDVQNEEIDRPRAGRQVDPALFEERQESLRNAERVWSDGDGAERELREARARGKHSGVGLEESQQTFAPTRSRSAPQVDLRQSTIEDERVELVEIRDVRVERGGPRLEGGGHLAEAHAFEPVGRELTERLQHDRVAAERGLRRTSAATRDLVGLEWVSRFH